MEAKVDGEDADTAERLAELEGMLSYAASGTEDVLARVAEAEMQIAELKVGLQNVSRPDPSMEQSLLFRMAQAEDQIHSLKDCMHVAGLSHSTAQEALGQAQRDIAALNASVVRGDMHQSKHALTVQRLEAKLAEAASDILALGRRLGSAIDEDAEEDDLLSRLAEAEGEIARLRGSLYGEDNGGSGTDDSLRAMLTDAEDSLEALQQRVDGADVSQPHAGLTARLGEAESQIQALQERLGDASDEDSDAEDMLTRLSEAEADIVRLKDSLYGEENSDSDEEDSLKMMLEAAQADIDELKERLDGASEAEPESAEEEGLGAKVAETEAKIQTIERRLGWDSKQDSDSEDVMSQLSNAWDEIAALKDSVYGEDNEDSDAENSLRTRLEAAEADIEALEERQSGDSDAEPDSDEEEGVQARLAEAESKILALETSLGDASEEDSDAEDVLSRLSEAEGEIGRLRDSLYGEDNEDSDAEDSLRTRLEAAEAEIEAVRHSVDGNDIEAGLLEKLEDAVMGIRAMEERLGFNSEYESDSEDVVSQLADAKKEISQLKKSLYGTGNEDSDAEDSLKSMLELAQGNIGALEERLVAHSDAMSAALEMCTRLEEVEGNVDDLIETVYGDADGAEGAEGAGLKGELKEAQELLQELRERVDGDSGSCADSLEALSKKLEAAKRQIALLREDLCGEQSVVQASLESVVTEADAQLFGRAEPVPTGEILAGMKLQKPRSVSEPVPPLLEELYNRKNRVGVTVEEIKVTHPLPMPSLQFLCRWGLCHAQQAIQHFMMPLSRSQKSIPFSVPPCN